MPRIEGPVKITENAVIEIGDEVDISLPFTAEGMSVSKNQDIIDKLGYGKKKSGTNSSKKKSGKKTTSKKKTKSRKTRKKSRRK